MVPINCHTLQSPSITDHFFLFSPIIIWNCAFTIYELSMIPTRFKERQWRQETFSALFTDGTAPDTYWSCHGDVMGEVRHSNSSFIFYWLSELRWVPWANPLIFLTHTVLIYRMVAIPNVHLTDLNKILNAHVPERCKEVYMHGFIIIMNGCQGYWQNHVPCL